MFNPISLQQLIEKEYFIACPLKDTEEFIDYCAKRAIRINRDQLEQFEKLGILKPLARFRRQGYKTKVKDYTDLGILQDGEEWDGEIEIIYDRSFSFSSNQINQSFEEGDLWEPASRDFQKWENFRDEQGHEFVISYYSIFQCYELYHLLQLTQITVNILSLDNIDKVINWKKEWLENSIDPIKQYKIPWTLASTICQILSNRFFYETRTDKRRITISESLEQWNSYCKNWDATAIKEELGISNDDIKRLHKQLIMDAEHIDPLESWYELVSFISVNEKERLKGDALFAQSIYAMEYMVRLFYKNLTGEDLPTPQTDWGHWHPDNYHGEGVSENYLEYLEFLTNSYNINPKPKLILVVEGYGEAAEFPRLAQKLLGYSFAKQGVEVFNLTGIDGFVGNQKIDYKYGALEKFIDYHYSKQTIVYIILDNEGGKGKGASKVRDHLVKRMSKINPPYSVIPEDSIPIWDRTTEYDNFSSEEIARAMTEVSDEIYMFSAKEIDESKKNWDKEPKDYLSILYNDKIGHELNKTNLMKILFDYIIQNRQNEFDSHGIGNRKIVKKLQEIKKLVSMNHQPGNKKTKELNQPPVRGEK